MTSFADLSAWTWLIQFFIIVVALLVANLVRCNVPLFRRSLLPSALLAGVLILCIKPLGFFSTLVDKHAMEIVTYHALGLGFVAMALKNKKIKSATSTIKVVETGAVTASTYILQGLVGLIVTVPLFPKVRFTMGDGRSVTIQRQGNGEKITRILCGSKPLKGWFVNHNEMLKAGELTIVTE